MYTKEQLKNFLENTMLISEDQKKELLSKTWDESTIKFLSNFFDKYKDKEKQLTNLVNNQKSMFTAKTIKKIEEDYFSKIESKEIKQIEEKIQKI